MGKWQIAKEKKTLSDKVIWGNSPSDARYNELDVMKAIKRYRERINPFETQVEETIAKEIFGERLI